MGNRSTDPTALLVGFIAGGLIGASIALLFAPVRGKKLRADIRRKAEGFKDDTEEYIGTASGKASDAARSIKKGSGQLLNEAQRKASQLIESAEQALHKGGRS